MTDTIIYVVKAEPGGCDGMDRDAKGGPVHAYATRAEAEAYVGRDSRYEIVPEVIDVLKECRVFHASCTPKQQLLMSLVSVTRSKHSKGSWNFALCQK